MIHFLLAIIYLSFISLGLPDSLLGSAWPSMYGELQVSISSAGIISMLIAGCTIISSLFCERLIRTLGTGRLTALSVGMTAAALFGFSISGSFWQLCLWSIPYGLGAGSVDAALNNYVALHFKARHMLWLHCFWGIGATLGPYIMGICLTKQMGWDAGYRTISILQFILTAVLIFTLPLWTKIHNHNSEESSAAPPRRFRELLSLPGTVPVLISFFCYCSLESVAGLWGSSYMVLKKGILPDAAASFSSLFYLGITGGRALSGFLTLRLNHKAMIRLGQGSAFLGILLLIIAWNPVSVCVGFLFIGLGCAPIYPSLLHQTPERFGSEVSQSMMGLQMACAYIGSTFSPLLAGFLTEQISITLYPVLLLFFVLFMTAMVERCNRRAAVK